MSAAFYVGRIVWVRWGFDAWRAGVIVDRRYDCVDVRMVSDGRTIHVHHSVFARDLRVTRPRGTR